MTQYNTWQTIVCSARPSFFASLNSPVPQYFCRLSKNVCARVSVQIILFHHSYPCFSDVFGFHFVFRQRDSSMLVFTFVPNKLVVLLSFTVTYRRHHIQLLKQAKSQKCYTRGTGPPFHELCITHDLCIVWCAVNVRINNSRHRP